jgi:hypothetical protein
VAFTTKLSSRLRSLIEFGTFNYRFWELFYMEDFGINNAGLQRKKELESGVFFGKKQVRFYFATLIA